MKIYQYFFTHGNLPQGIRYLDKGAAMHFGLSMEISEDVDNKAHIITAVANSLKECFRNKHYGAGIEWLTIGILCVHPKFDFFFKVRKKYTKSKKMLEYDIQLDHSHFEKANETEIRGMLRENIINSLMVIAEMKINGFNVDQFRNDIEICFAAMLKTE